MLEKRVFKLPTEERIKSGVEKGVANKWCSCSMEIARTENKISAKRLHQNATDKLLKVNLKGKGLFITISFGLFLCICLY